MVTLNRITEHTAHWMTNNQYDLDWKPQDVKDLKRLVDERLGKPRNEGFIRGIKTVQWDLVYKLFWGKESEMK